MAMSGIGFAELLMLLFLGRGGSPELLGLIDADDYFAARNIKAGTVEQLVSLAANKAPEPREAVVRLLAIRTLGEHKDAASARAALTKIAAEPAGFAKDYAERALAALDGKAVKPAAMPKGSVTDDALAFFPADVDFFGALDRRGVPGGLGGDEKKLTALRKELPDEMKEGIYKFAEAVGNIRVDRVSFAFCEEPKDTGGRIMIRLSGLCDRTALSSFVASTCRNPNVQEDKAAGTILISHDRAPHFLFIGDTELVMAGSGHGSNTSASVMQQLLDVRAGKKPSVTKGAFSKDLKAIAPDVFGLVFGALSESMRKDLARGFGVAPLNVAVEWAPADKGLRMRVKAETEDADQAKRLVDGATGLRAMALEGLKQAPPRDVPAELKPGLVKVLEGLTFRAADKTAIVELAVSDEVLRGMTQSLMLLMTGARSAPPRRLADPPPGVAVPKSE